MKVAESNDPLARVGHHTKRERPARIAYWAMPALGLRSKFGQIGALGIRYRSQCLSCFYQLNIGLIISARFNGTRELE